MRCCGEGIAPSGWGGRGIGSLAAALLLCASPAAFAAPPGPPAKAAPPPARNGDDEEEDEQPTIVVNGQRQPGAVVGDIPAEEQLTPADIRSYGVSSINDLLAELAPETRSDRGRGSGAPVVLLNGRRISSLAEIRDIPTEAILRVDILPEEVALKYGYTADQRVVNIVLRRRFHAITGELAGSTTAEGGGSAGTASADLLRIHRDDRLQIDLKYQASASLLESDRGLALPATGRPFDLAGNIAAVPGGATQEIDPALSALAGQPVTIAGVPASAAAGRPGLADFLGTANRANSTDVSPYRTLTPATHEFTLNTVLSRRIFGNVSATLNGTLDISNSASLNGLPGAGLLLPAGNPFSPFGEDVELYRYLGTSPLTQNVHTVTGHLGFSMNGDIAHWRWSFTGNYDYSDASTVTRTGFDVTPLQALLDAGDPGFNPFAPISSTLVGGALLNRATALGNSGNVQVQANGPLFTLPAGAVTTSIKLGEEASGFDARSMRAGIAQNASLFRNDVNAHANLDIPIASRKRHVLSALGALTANVNAAVDRLSDFGTLKAFGYGANWSPVDQVTLLVSVTDDQSAPTMQQLGNPQVLTPGVRALDYLSGQTVDVTQIGGGNPDLKADHRHVLKLGLTVKPLAKGNLTISANYIRSRIRNAIAAFPEPTAAIEAAFPDRFVRDDDGDLERIDVRPINFLREDRQELRWGINFTQPLKSNTQRLFEAWRSRYRPRLSPGEGENGATPPPPGNGGAGAGDASGGGQGPGHGGTGPDGDRGGGGPGQGFGGGHFGGGGRGGAFRAAARNAGRLQIAVYHTWYFRDDVLIREGVPVLDLLNGDAIGSTGGQPRHQVDLQLGYSNNGLGARMSGSWQSGTTVRGAPGSATETLTFSPLATANLRLFLDLGQQPALAGRRWARGARITLSVTNLLDARLRVRDATGVTPLRYDPYYLDAAGRTVRLSLRKLFY